MSDEHAVSISEERAPAPEPRVPLRWVRPPLQARSQRTLERLFDAAEALVAEKGFEDATVGEVVRRAASSVGAFYARFGDKSGLLYALYARFLDQATATADDALDPARWEGAKIPEIIGSIVPFLVAIYRERRGLMRVFALRNRTDAEFRARQERLSHHVSTRLCALLLARREGIGHANPERATAFGLSMTFSAIEDAVLFSEMRSGVLSLSDSDLSAELTRAFLAYLGVPCAPARHPGETAP